MDAVIIAVLIAIGFALYLILADLRKIFMRQNSILGERSLALDEKLQNLEEKLYRLEEKIDSIEYNTLSPLQKECRVFDRAQALPLARIRAFKAGETFHLISKSYVYPRDEPYATRFAFKYDHIDEASLSKFGYEVHGYWKLSGSSEWQPYQFLSSEKESLTTTCEGTIRQL